MSAHRARRQRSATTLGLCLIAAATALTFVEPLPSAAQSVVIRAILALGAAGVVQGFSGFLVVSTRSRFYWVRAGGPLAVAVGVYFVNPLY